MERLRTFRHQLRGEGPWPLRRDYSQEQIARRVAGVIAKVDSVMDRCGEPRVAKGRLGCCGLTSDLVKRAAERTGMRGYTFQALTIHEDYGANPLDAFQHAFNIVSSGSSQFIVDASFGQFVNLETGQIGDGGLISGLIEDNPIALRLLRDGYVPLTDESVRDYLRATTGALDKSHTQRITAREIVSNKELWLGFDRPVSVIDDYLDGRATPGI